MNSPLRICIDARDGVGSAGGTATFILSLVRALTNLDDGDEQYFFLVKNGEGPALEHLLQRPLQVIELTPSIPIRSRPAVARIPFASGVLSRLRILVNHLEGIAGYSVAKSDGTVEREKIDVIHFTTQGGFLTDIPFIYHPHDLQHRHLPQFFTATERSFREHWYSTLCDHASVVSVVSKWVKQDLINSFNTPESKIRVVHFAPDSTTCSVVDAEVAKLVGQKFSLPQKFIFYPARTWPHKNHLRLLQALKILRDDHGLTIHLVCSGGPTRFYEVLKSESKAMGLSNQVIFVGFVSLEELSALYRLSSAVIIPTLFEAGSFPLWEAFLSERPAACSNVTSLPAQAGDAALIFDPMKVDEIADAVRRLWTDSELCATLVERGRANISRYSWDTTARTFRALYRQLGNRQLTAEDERLLSSPPLM
jgi:glycosyltransferase involved in cell wall biosynthesis